MARSLPLDCSSLILLGDLVKVGSNAFRPWERLCPSSRSRVTFARLLLEQAGVSSTSEMMAMIETLTGVRSQYQTHPQLPATPTNRRAEC